MRLTIPNQLTLLRIILTLVFLYYFLEADPNAQLIASIIFIMASLTDWYDGWFARRFGVITRWGQFMDPLADKFLVSSALIVFAVMDYVKWWMVWIIVGRDILVTIIRIYAINKGRPIVTSILAKWKTFIQMIIILVILGYINWLNFYGAGSFTYHARYLDPIGLSMLFVTLLTLVSAILYIYENWRLIWRMLKELFARSSR
jgi:CDP-diacylglycerol--glycerol-3-phosphate 3-phosphatidyltransferase